MMYIENIFICISIPLFLSLIFIRGDMRKYMMFICIGMGMCAVSYTHLDVYKRQTFNLDFRNLEKLAKQDFKTMEEVVEEILKECISLNEKMENSNVVNDEELGKICLLYTSLWTDRR